MGGDPLNRIMTTIASTITTTDDIAGVGGFIRVVRIPSTEGHVFRSKERTPVLLLMEVIDESAEEEQQQQQGEEKEEGDLAKNGQQLNAVVSEGKQCQSVPTHGSGSDVVTSLRIADTDTNYLNQSRSFDDEEDIETLQVDSFDESTPARKQRPLEYRQGSSSIGEDDTPTIDSLSTPSRQRSLSDKSGDILEGASSGSRPSPRRKLVV
jgi:hypothetical protein